MRPGKNDEGPTGGAAGPQEQTKLDADSVPAPADVGKHEADVLNRAAASAVVAYDLQDDAARLCRLLRTAPATHSAWSYQRTLDYKAAVMRANAAISKKYSKPQSIHACLVELLRFYPEALL